MTSPTPQAITDYIHAQMPLTRAMGIQVVQAQPQMTRLIAPLGPNLNHQQTAFGGSIATLGITAGWVYLHCRLQDEGLASRLIIQKSQVEYLHPIAGEMEACCGQPEPGEWASFLEKLRQRGRARITRPVQIQCAGRIGAIHHGVYVAMNDAHASRAGVMG